MQLFMTKWVMQEFSVTEQGIGMLLVRLGNHCHANKPYLPCLAALLGRRLQNKALHQGLAKIVWSQPRRRGCRRLSEHP